MVVNLSNAIDGRNSVRVKLSPAMHAQLVAAAAADRRKIQEWVRLVIEDALAAREKTSHD